MQSQFVKRVCDFCNASLTVPVAAKLSPKEAREFASWFIIMQEIPKADEGMDTVVKHGCGVNCAQALIRQAEETDKLSRKISLVEQ